MYLFLKMLYDCLYVCTLTSEQLDEFNLNCSTAIRPGQHQKAAVPSFTIRIRNN